MIRKGWKGEGRGRKEKEGEERGRNGKEREGRGRNGERRGRKRKMKNIGRRGRVMAIKRDSGRDPKGRISL